MFLGDSDTFMLNEEFNCVFLLMDILYETIYLSNTVL